MKNYKIKIGKFKYVIWIFCLFTVVFLFMSGLISILFPQKDITINQIAQTEYGIKDYQVLNDGSLISTSFDSWVYLRYDELDIVRPLVVSVDIESVEDLDSGYLMYYVNSYLFQSGEKKIGINTQPLRYGTSLDDGIRFDFTTLEGQKIKINNFRVNDNALLANYFQREWIKFSLYCLLTVIIVSLLKKQCNYAQKGDGMPTGWLLGGVYWLIGCFFALNTPEGVEENLIKAVVCVLFVLLSAVLFFQYEQKKNNFWNKVANNFFVIFAVYLAMEIGFHAILFSYERGEWNNYLIHFFSTATMLNILFLILMYSGMASLAGFGLTNLISCALGIVIGLGNVIKLYFQRELLTIADLYLIKEIVGISEQYISFPAQLVLLFLLCLCIGVAIWKRQVIIRKLKPVVYARYIWLLVPAIIYCILLRNNIFYGAGIDADREYSQQKQAFDDYGIILYYFYMFSNGISTQVPEGYDASLVQQVDAYKDASKEVDSVRPNVILILAESLFRVDQLPGIEFNYNLFENIGSYIRTSLISPSYGGRTAAAELEALTGYTNYFFPDDVIAYTTYITNPKRKTGGLAREFGDAGYYTVAMHPNRADYYNRDTVYESMGFDEFLDKMAFDTSENNVLKDGFLKDEAFFSKMIDVLNEAESPIFIFGATIEGHSPYNEKFNSINVQAKDTLGKYSESALRELSAYGQTVYDLDQQLGRLFSYLDQCGTPTLVYVFGDHLPPLEIYSECNYLQETSQKFSVPLIVYSNFSDVKYESQFSLSQLAPVILKEANISHRSYFDFLYQFSLENPVIHKQFPIDYTEEMLLYEKIQYDSLFGENYLIN